MIQPTASPSPPANLAQRVSGETGIIFRQFSFAAGQDINVDASGLEDVNGAKSVLQIDQFQVPVLGSSIAWIREVDTPESSRRFF